MFDEVHRRDQLYHPQYDYEQGKEQQIITYKLESNSLNNIYI